MAKHQKNKYLDRLLIKTDILPKILMLSIIVKQKLFYPKNIFFRTDFKRTTLHKM